MLYWFADWFAGSISTCRVIHCRGGAHAAPKGVQVMAFYASGVSSIVTGAWGSTRGAELALVLITREQGVSAIRGGEFLTALFTKEVPRAVIRAGGDALHRSNEGGSRAGADCGHGE